MAALPPELVKAELDTEEDALSEAGAGAGTIVGAPTTEQMRSGVVAIASVGQARREQYLPLVRQQLGIRCIGTSEYVAELIGSYIYGRLHERRRRLVRQPSTDELFLVHWTSVSGGPSLTQGETEDFKEVTLVLETMVGTEASVE